MSCEGSDRLWRSGSQDHLPDRSSPVAERLLRSLDERAAVRYQAVRLFGQQSFATKALSAVTPLLSARLAQEVDAVFAGTRLQASLRARMNLLVALGGRFHGA